MIFLATVWHTGTHSVRSQIPATDVYWHHCGADVLSKLDGGPGLYREVVTTYRDPYQVAVSWANRDQLEADEWCGQWDCWAGLMAIKEQYFDWVKLIKIDDTLPRLNTQDDKLNLYPALRDGDMDYYYSQVDKQLLDYALDITDAN